MAGDFRHLVDVARAPERIPCTQVAANASLLCDVCAPPRMYGP